jgi:hypothetical protein
MRSWIFSAVLGTIVLAANAAMPARAEASWLSHAMHQAFDPNYSVPYGPVYPAYGPDSWAPGYGYYAPEYSYYAPGYYGGYYGPRWHDYDHHGGYHGGHRGDHGWHGHR